MDHLPNPIDGAHEEVRFHAESKTYQPGEFFRFPASYMKEKHFASLDDLVHHGFKKPDSNWPVKRLNELVQSWLLFALLAQVVGEPIDASQFRTSNNDFTTHRLKDVLSNWSEAWRENAESSEPTDLSKQKNGYVQASMALEYARRFCWKHLAHRPHEEDDYGGLSTASASRQLKSPHDQLDQKMVLSIMSVGEILQDELWTRLPPRQKDRVQFWKQPEDEERNWGYSHWCRETMRKNGWCPADIRRAEGTMPHVNVLYYVCTMSSGDKRKKGEESNRELHKMCSAWMCEAQSRETESLTALHMHKDTNRCPPAIGPNSIEFDEGVELESIIDQNLVPLVKWTHDGRLKCKGHNLDTDSTIQFGAVSHAWGDKILDHGVTHSDRSILRCQLDNLRSRLTDIFNKLESDPLSRQKKEDQNGDEPWFWVDVLCCPPSWRRSVRLLNRLHIIYEKAAVVLIWDRNLLQQKKPAEEEYIETTVRLNTGQWSRRLWTLPEAVLANSLYVSFQNGHLSLEKLEEACDKARGDMKNNDYFIWKAGRPFTSAIGHIRAQLHNHDSGIAYSGLEHTLPVQSVWKALQFREATYPDDQFLVLASVLGLDMSRFVVPGLEFPTPEPNPHERGKRTTDDPDSKMVGFLNALDEAPSLGIPSGLIFLPQPKLSSQKAYGWAPGTWMSKQLYTYPLFRPLHKTGHMLQHGLHVKFPGIILHSPDPVIGSKDFWVPVSQTLIKWYKVEIDAAGTSIEKLRAGLSTRDEHCIILNAAKTRERWEAGLLVRRNGLLACGTVWRAQPICRLWVRLETRTSKLQTLRKNFYEDSKSQYFGERVDNQSWCIENPLLQYSAT